MTNRPFASRMCAVIDAHYFDGRRLDPIDDDKGKRCQHELASACYPAAAAAMGEQPQIGAALVNGIGDSARGLAIVLTNSNDNPFQVIG